MANGVVMPKAGISVESCIIGQWRKKIGDEIEKGEILFDYETDKAVFECEATESGTLLAIFYEAGDEVKCLEVVGALGKPGEDYAALEPQRKEEKLTTKTKAVKAVSQALPLATGNQEATAVSPRARTLAQKLNVDLNNISPSGPEGRIIERDVIAYSQAEKSGSGIGGRDFSEKVNEDTLFIPPDLKYSEEKLSQPRKMIAATMYRSLAEMAQLTHHHSFDATKLLAARQEFKKDGKNISLNDLVMLAVADTLSQHQSLNAWFADERIIKFSGVHLGMAVDTPRGLLVPTIFNAETLNLSELAEKAHELAGQASSGSISPDLLKGGSFTVSNLGGFGVEMFTPIINPPQVAILGVCTITSKVREDEGGLTVYPAMGLSLTYDHRVIDGADAARFMQALVKTLSEIDILIERKMQVKI